MSFKKFLDGRDDPIRRYVAWVANRYHETLDEAARRSLGRVMGLVQDAKEPQALMTAFRDERPLHINRRLNKQLESDIRSQGWGFIPVLGGFIEKIRGDDGEETGEKKNVEEESYFIVGRGDKSSFRNQVLELIIKYEQESATVKYTEDKRAFLLEADGNEFPLGVWSQNKMAEYYTKMKKGAKGRQFAFEPNADEPQFEFIAAGDSSRSTKMAVDLFLRD